jgi:hypothetical protein
MLPDIDASRAIQVIRADREGRPAPDAEALERIQTERQVLTMAADRALAGPRSMWARTGNAWLDEYTGGLEIGFNWVVAAQSGFGKSTLAAAIADENLGVRKVLIGSTEDVARLYGARILCRRTRVNAKRFKWGKLWDEEKQLVRDALARARELPLFIDWNGVAAEQIARDIAGYKDREGKIHRGLIRQHGIEILLLDWLQKIPTEKRCENERKRVWHAYDCVSRACKTAGCVLIAFSQVTPTDTPGLGWIRDSRDVGMLSDVAVLGLRQIKKDENGKTVLTEDGVPKLGKRRFLVPKVKDEEAGRSCPAGWDDDSASFQPLVKHTSEQPPDDYYDHRLAAAGDLD